MSSFFRFLVSFFSLLNWEKTGGGLDPDGAPKPDHLSGETGGGLDPNGIR